MSDEQEKTKQTETLVDRLKHTNRISDEPPPPPPPTAGDIVRDYYADDLGPVLVSDDLAAQQERSKSLWGASATPE